MAAVLNVRFVDDVAVVDVSGRITLGDSSTALHRQMVDLMAERHSKILLNLAGMSFMDSAGLGEMVRGCVSISHAKGRVKLCALTRRMRDLMEVTRLHTVLDIYDREEDALRSFG